MTKITFVTSEKLLASQKGHLLQLVSYYMFTVSYIKKSVPFSK
jgi:hypothetical protein